LKNYLTSGQKFKTDNLIFNPELVSHFLKTDLTSQFLLWTMLRNMDITSGQFHISILKALTTEYLGLQSTHIYKLIEKGEDVFWNRSKKDKKIFYIVSLKKVCVNIEFNINRSEPFVIPISLFDSHGYKNTKDVKNIMISLIASRYVDERPISIKSLCENTGQSESTVRNALRDCPHVKVLKNIKIEPISEAYQALRLENKATYLSGSNLITQLPNSYQFLEAYRLPLKTRPKELKKLNPNFSLTTK
jgi:hypothetical protein